VKTAWRRHAFPSLTRLRALHDGDLDALIDDAAPPAVASAEQLEEARREGHAEGHGQGLAEGRVLGERDAVVRVDQGLAALSAPVEELIAGLGRLREQHLGALRQEMLPLLEQVARQVIRTELEMRPEQLLAFVEEALATLPVQDAPIEIRLHPDEYRRLLASAPEQAARWQLRPDERLDHGECRIQAGPRELDAGCGQRLAACMEQLHQLVSGDGAAA